MSKSLEESPSYQIIQIAKSLRIISSDEAHRFANFLLNSRQLARMSTPSDRGSTRSFSSDSSTSGLDHLADDPRAFLIHLQQNGGLSESQLEQLTGRLDLIRTIVHDVRQSAVASSTQTLEESSHTAQTIELEAQTMELESASADRTSPTKIAPAVNDFTQELRGRRQRRGRTDSLDKKSSSEIPESRRSRKMNSKRRKKEPQPWRPPVDFGFWYEQNKLFIITAILILGIASVAYKLLS